MAYATIDEIANLQVLLVDLLVIVLVNPRE
jgi:hypothetical protein